MAKEESDEVRAREAARVRGDDRDADHRPHDAIAGQIQVITDTMIDVLDDQEFDDITDHEVEPVSALDPSTVELIVGLAVYDGRIFAEINGDLIEEREAKGRVEYRRIGPDGERGPWKDAPPPPSRSRQN